MGSIALHASSPYGSFTEYRDWTYHAPRRIEVVHARWQWRHGAPCFPKASRMPAAGFADLVVLKNDCIEFVSETIAIDGFPLPPIELTRLEVWRSRTALPVLAIVIGGAITRA